MNKVGEGEKVGGGASFKFGCIKAQEEIKANIYLKIPLSGFLQILILFHLFVGASLPAPLRSSTHQFEGGGRKELEEGIYIQYIYILSKKPMFLCIVNF